MKNFTRWFRAMLVEMVSLLSVPLIRLMPQGKVAGGGTPVLLIHGYVNHGSVWNVVKWRLQAQGLGPIYTINLGHPFLPIEVYAEKVAKRVEELVGLAPIILVGHSMGGLVAAYYAAHLAKGNVRLITIGSPFNGTPVAKLAVGKNARQMEPNSQFLADLRNELHRLKIFRISTKTDQLVVPGASIEDDYILGNVGHQSLLYSKRVADKLTEVIRQQS